MAISNFIFPRFLDIKIAMTCYYPSNSYIV